MLWAVLTGLYCLNRILFVYHHDISAFLCVFLIHLHCEDDPPDLVLFRTF